MKRNIFLIIMLGLVMLFSSCSEYTANTPAERFTREDWDVCGFEPWAGREDFEARFVTDGWLCADGEGSWSNSTHFCGGSICIGCGWLLGKEYKRLYTNLHWDVAVTDMSSGVSLPRGLRIGSNMKQVENTFALGSADERGNYYGDGENAPYAKIEDLGYDSKKEITLAIPAEETNDERFNYICLLRLTFTDDAMSEFRYISTCKYRILPGLPEPEQADEVRVYSIGSGEPDKTLKFEEAADMLACIQNAGTNLSEQVIIPTHRIEVLSGGDTYTLQYGHGLVAVPGGTVYRIWGIDEEALFSSLPGLRSYKYSYMREEQHGITAELSKEQEEKIKKILDNIVTCSDIAVGSGNCHILIVSGEDYIDITYIIGTPHILLEDRLYHMTEEDADYLARIYRDAFENNITNQDPGDGNSIGQGEGNPEPALSKEPLLPGLPSPAEITEVRIWRIGEEGVTFIWQPFESAGLYEIIQAGSGKPLKGKLESPTHKIQIRSGSKRYDLTVGSNGIETPEGKLYEVLFTENDARIYLPASIWNPDDPYIVPPKGGFVEGWIRGTGGLVKELSEEQILTVSDTVDDMTPCEDARPRGNFFAFSLVRDEWFSYEYYFGTNYIRYEVQGRVKKSLFTISDEDAEALTQIYNELFKE